MFCKQTIDLELAQSIKLFYMNSKHHSLSTEVSPSESLWLTWLTLLTTSSTFICCALPILFVSLGMGTAVASLTSSFPQLIWLSEHKNWLFFLSAMLLFFSSWLVYSSGRTCPSDPRLASICQKAQLLNRRILFGSIAIWGIGFFTAFLLLPLRLWMESL